ncbi:glycosyltransferase, partial [Candidatus Bathyarchaeota archaeon]|nr:glycosyltransferase [Candidatus Bathyarchaeota archaeon]
MVKGDRDPFVSIIIPAFNSEATIKDLLESLMLLDYSKDNLEIIIVDGGSTDRTMEIAKSYPVRIIVESRKGINVARNAGVKSSKGEILVFTDSDCVIPK